MRNLLAAYGEGTGGGARATAHLLQDYILKAVALATQLGLGDAMLCGGDGNEAWSPLEQEVMEAPVASLVVMANGGQAAHGARAVSPVVPVHGVLARIKIALHHDFGTSHHDDEATL